MAFKCFFVLMWARTTIFDRCFGTRTEKLLNRRAMAVKFRQALELKWEDDEWHSIPSSLLANHGGKQYLKIRPTHHAIVALLTSKKCDKNASFASSEALGKLMQARNDAALVLHGSKKSESVAENVAEDEGLFQKDSLGSGKEESAGEEREAAAKRRKKRIPGGRYLVTIKVGDEKNPVECLVQGARPACSDLLILLDSKQLEAAFTALKEDVEACLNAKPRQYKKKDKASK